MSAARELLHQSESCASDYRLVKCSFWCVYHVLYSIQVIRRLRFDHHPSRSTIPRGTAIISFPARSADWLVAVTEEREERRGKPTRTVLLVLAPSGREDQR